MLYVVLNVFRVNIEDTSLTSINVVLLPLLFTLKKIFAVNFNHAFTYSNSEEVFAC